MEGDPAPTSNKKPASNLSTVPTDNIPIVMIEYVVHPPEHHRQSSYPRRILVPKRQWDESLQSVFELLQPKSFTDAMVSPDTHLWKVAMQEEHDSLIHNQTWTFKQLQ
jgi:hypothetical protein